MSQAYLVVRACIDPTVMDEFVCWYKQEHLPHVMAIPGVAKAFRSTARGGGCNWTAVYELSDDVTVGQVLTSSEANVARQDWARWIDHVTELSVSVYAAVTPMHAFHRWN
jgi:hypothetical protein